MALTPILLSISDMIVISYYTGHPGGQHHGTTVDLRWISPGTEKTGALLTDGSGCIVAYVLDLLSRGHPVVTTIQSNAKAKTIQRAHLELPKSKLDFKCLEDVAQPDAFSPAMISGPPFEAVIHMASLLHFHVIDTKKDLLDPAINGTTRLLHAIKTYCEASFYPITPAQATQSPQRQLPRQHDLRHNRRLGLHDLLLFPSVLNSPKFAISLL